MRHELDEKFESLLKQRLVIANRTFEQLKDERLKHLSKWLFYLLTPDYSRCAADHRVDLGAGSRGCATFLLDVFRIHTHWWKGEDDNQWCGPRIRKLPLSRI